jgi:transcription elongation factor Elf1
MELIDQEIEDIIKERPFPKVRTGPKIIESCLECGSDEILLGYSHKEVTISCISCGKCYEYEWIE